ncbi:hypothetical protein [Ectopseudomonas khazarica]|uniref:hypothetical protein n=1 Tax=Ectopseudomonas khazarica TaxID=2502979 RepID=UPI0037CB19C1
MTDLLMGCAALTERGVAQGMKGSAHSPREKLHGRGQEAHGTGQTGRAGLLETQYPGQTHAEKADNLANTFD